MNEGTGAQLRRATRAGAALAERNLYQVTARAPIGRTLTLLCYAEANGHIRFSGGSMLLFRRITTLTAMTALTAACANDGSEENGAARGVQELSPEQIALLEDQYPRLGEEPMPEPRPSEDAQPARVPARLASRASEAVLETITGDATFYANTFEGRRTASGIPFRQNQFVAAHRAYPFGTILRVTNLGNDRAVNVRVVDRGPFGASARRGTVIDLSRRAAQDLDFIGAGRAQVRVEVLEWGRGTGAA